MHFADAKGLLTWPVAGQKILGFGDPDGLGGESQGVTMAARPGAAVLAPADGWVVYAGPFRSYGQVLILNAGDGYHIVLAGMERIDAALGQFVLGGEPVGVMGCHPAGKHRGHRPYFCPADSLCRVPQGRKLNRFSALVGAYGW